MTEKEGEGGGGEREREMGKGRDRRGDAGEGGIGRRKEIYLVTFCHI